MSKKLLSILFCFSIHSAYAAVGPLEAQCNADLKKQKDLLDRQFEKDYEQDSIKAHKTFQAAIQGPSKQYTECMKNPAIAEEQKRMKEEAAKAAALKAAAKIECEKACDKKIAFKDSCKKKCRL